MIVTKSEIINILSETHLTSGDFINNQGDMCAVGAILRAVTGVPYTTNEFRRLCEQNAPAAQRPNAKPYVETGDFMSALSIHFENVMYAYDDVYTEEVREEVLGFVQKFFPSEIKVYV